VCGKSPSKQEYVDISCTADHCVNTEWSAVQLTAEKNCDIQVTYEVVIWELVVHSTGSCKTMSCHYSLLCNLDTTEGGVYVLFRDVGI
jgi:hypothetical protein